MSRDIWNHSKASHIAFVVTDIEATLEHYCSIFQMEKPIIKQTGKPELAKIIYRGKPTEAIAKQAFLQFGTQRIEFMEPDMNESIWREHLEKKGPGIHHIAFEIDDMEETLAQLEKEDILPIQEGAYQKGRYAYVENEDKLAVMIELLQNDK